MIFPPEFIAHIGQQNIPNLDEFLAAHDVKSPTSIRINPYKSPLIPKQEQVPWCKWGFYLDERPVFTLDPSFHSGSYYVQEASSMAVQFALDFIFNDIKNPLILDISAAPGGKSTLISAMIAEKGDGTLISNDIITSRAYVLKYNLAKEGHAHTIVTNASPESYAKLPPLFDVILLDAPCSGEGMFRKEENAILHWSRENVASCSIRQRRILNDVDTILLPGGYLIYSTCTYNELENIDNLLYIQSKGEYESVPLNFPMSWNIEEIKKQDVYGYRFLPHKVKGEGFFLAVLRKKRNHIDNIKPLKTTTVLNAVPSDKKKILSEWVNFDDSEFEIKTDKVENLHLYPSDIEPIVEHLSKSGIPIIDVGTTLGKFNKDVFIPHHHLALSIFTLSKIEKIELNLKDALLYLKREIFEPMSEHKGWAMATYENNGIGWMKLVNGRVNNYLPKELVIRMEINK
ncbi:MAG: hypothetical protein H6567_09415 [Lewinellaceae bacterium]|nr:hypothetical protein [Lewinellaceae bacterium]